jgi:hypothetical protein
MNGRGSALRCIAKKIAIAKNIAMHRNLLVVGYCAIRFNLSLTMSICSVAMCEYEKSAALEPETE